MPMSFILEFILWLLEITGGEIVGPILTEHFLHEERSKNKKDPSNPNSTPK
jgi:hypothetical protein